MGETTGTGGSILVGGTSFLGTGGMVIGVVGCEGGRVSGPVVIGDLDSILPTNCGVSLGEEGPIGTRLMRRFSDVSILRGNAGGCLGDKGGMEGLAELA